MSAGVPFPKDFEGRLKNIYKRLFRVYAHMYHSHIEKIISLGTTLGLIACHLFSFISVRSLRLFFGLPFWNCIIAQNQLDSETNMSIHFIFRMHFLLVKDAA